MIERLIAHYICNDKLRTPTRTPPFRQRQEFDLQWMP